MSPHRPEKSCRVNKMKKVLRDTLLPLFMHIYIGREPGRRSALEIQGKTQRQRRRGILKLRAPDNQYLTTSRQFCWRDGNMKKTASQPLSSLSPVSNMPLYHFYFMLTVNFWNAAPFLGILHSQFNINGLSFCCLRLKKTTGGKDGKSPVLNPDIYLAALLLSLAAIALNRPIRRRTEGRTHPVMIWVQRLKWGEQRWELSVTPWMTARTDRRID